MRKLVTAVGVAVVAVVSSGTAANGAVHALGNRAVCVRVTAGYERCLSRMVTVGGRTLAATSPRALRRAAGESGPPYGPAALHKAYRLPTAAPRPQTIAIVDAHSNPTVYRDLTGFSRTFGIPVLPRCGSAHQTACFAQVNQTGGRTIPAPVHGWGVEINLDVQTAHAICQNCKILLVLSKTSKEPDLRVAAATACRMGADEVSNSYGGPAKNPLEARNLIGYDCPGTAVVASSGDSDFGVGGPANLNTVISAGGTSLFVNGNGSYRSEAVWGEWPTTKEGFGTGSGCDWQMPITGATGSRIPLGERARPWQLAVPGWSKTHCGGWRGMNDVAADANPDTGVPVLDTYGAGGQKGWFQIGGTSLSSPLLAGVYALAANTHSVPYPAALAYRHPGALHDVLAGKNGRVGVRNPLTEQRCTARIQCHASRGYDLPTGLGTPNGLGAF